MPASAQVQVPSKGSREATTARFQEPDRSQEDNPVGHLLVPGGTSGALIKYPGAPFQAEMPEHPMN